MALALRNGDYVPDGMGGLNKVSGREALLQQVLFRLTARRGMFPFWEGLGSRLRQLGKIPGAGRQAAAKQYVAEALAEESGLTVERVELCDGPEGAMVLTVELSHAGEAMAVTLDVLA